VPGRVTLPPSQKRPPSTDGPSFYKLRYTTVRLCALIVGRRRIGLEPRHSSLFGRHTMLASSQPSAPNAFNHLASRNISFSFDVSAARTARKASAATLSLSPLSQPAVHAFKLLLHSGHPMGPCLGYVVSLCSCPPPRALRSRHGPDPRRCSAPARSQATALALQNLNVLAQLARHATNRDACCQASPHQ
jgi:hypothetical protein